VKSFRNQTAIVYLRKFVLPMLTKSEKILMNLNSKQKPLCQLATAELFPNETGKQQKMTKARLGLMP